MLVFLVLSVPLCSEQIFIGSRQQINLGVSGAITVSWDSVLHWYRSSAPRSSDTEASRHRIQDKLPPPSKQVREIFKTCRLLPLLSMQVLSYLPWSKLELRLDSKGFTPTRNHQLRFQNVLATLKPQFKVGSPHLSGYNIYIYMYICLLFKTNLSKLEDLSPRKTQFYSWRCFCLLSRPNFKVHTWVPTSEQNIKVVFALH